MHVDRETWAKRFLKRIEAPVQQSTLRAMVTWMQAEGSNADWNPLATTQSMPGATNFNSVGVKNYPDQSTGYEAVIKTLDQGGHGYDRILRRLRKPDTASQILDAVGRSDWGPATEDYRAFLLEVLDTVKRNYDTFAAKPISHP